MITSGIGFIIDFSIYIINDLFVYGRNVREFLQCVFSILFVFIVSTKKIFYEQNLSMKNTVIKLLIYFSYQFVLLIIVSTVDQKIYNLVMTYSALQDSENIIK